MKSRINNVAVFTLLIASLACAEFSMSTGFSAGVNLANQTVEDIDKVALSPTSLVGFDCGLLADINFGSFWSIMPGIAFSMRGSKTDSTTSFIMNQVTIPLLAKASLSFGVLKPYIAIGPELDILLKAGPRSTASGSPIFLDYASDYNKIDYAVKAAAGFDLKLGKVIPFVQAGYIMGLTNTVKEQIDFTTRKNQVVLVQAGLKFKI